MDLTWTPNQLFHARVPPRPKRALWPIVTERERGMRWTRSYRRAIWRGRQVRSRTVKSRGPDTPTLVSSEQNDLLMMGAKKPGSQGERGVSRKPLAQGRPG